MTTETKHTPGPWRRNSSEVFADAGVIVRASAAYNALGHDLDLIADAPDMYAALKQASCALRHVGVQPYPAGDNELAKALFVIDKAIAKAAGES